MVPYKLALDAVEGDKWGLNFKKSKKKSVKNWTSAKIIARSKG